MEFHYRGVVYDRTPSTVDTVESEVTVQYRGVPCHLRQARAIPKTTTHQRLKYRGAWVK